MGQRQLNRLLKRWVVEARLDPSDYGRISAWSGRHGRTLWRSALGDKFDVEFPYNSNDNWPEQLQTVGDLVEAIKRLLGGTQ